MDVDVAPVRTGRGLRIHRRRVAVVVIALTTILVAPGASFAFGFTILSDEPLSSAAQIVSSKMLAADGSLITNLRGEIHREPVPLEKIPSHMREAAVAIEDRRFWQHDGLDVRGIARAAMNNLRSDGGLEGGSTISQQLVKNIYFPNQPRTMWRKGLEALLSWGLENRASKEDILEHYLNTAYFGRGVYGVQTAARSYFDKDVSELTVGEGAYLAGILHRPAAYEWDTDDAPELIEYRRGAALARRDTVLRVMEQLGDLTPDERRRAAAEPTEVTPWRESRWQHPYFADAVLRELGIIGGHLQDRYDFLGEEPSERARAIYGGGYRIHTTMDVHAQRVAETAMRENLPDIGRLSGALVALDPRNGEIRAIVGGRAYYPIDCESDDPPPSCRHGKVNLALGNLGGGSGRQGGSAFKSITLAAAIEDGISVRQRMSSAPYTHALSDDDEWRVENYEGGSQGIIDVADATVRSVNAAYARLVVEGLGDGDAREGAAKVADISRRLGFSFPTEAELRDRCGDGYGRSPVCTPADAIPSITLGVKDISPLEMAAAYGTFAAGGVHSEPTTIRKITDADGQILYEAEPQRRRALEESTAAAATDVLRQVIERGTGRGAQLSDRPAAGKTGTSQAWRDAWFAGYVPQLAASVWVGNPEPVQTGDRWTVESMVPSNGYPRRIVGGSYPATIWREFMSGALEGAPALDFPEAPEDLGEEDEDFVDGSEEPEIAIGDGSATSTIMDLRRAGYSVVRHSQCPPGGGTRGIQIWRTEQHGNTVHVWVSRAVCR